MTLDEAKAVIDRAWNSGPSAVDWNDVEEASMVIAAETGEAYIPAEDDMAAWPGRVARKAPAPSSRGTQGGYDAAARQGDGIATGIANASRMLSSSRGFEKTSRGTVPRSRSMRDLLDRDTKPPGWP
jgi:hypothetical protein